MRKQFINRRGEVVYLDDDSGIVPDGYGVRVPIHLQDSVQQAIATSNVRLTDALGRPAGQRPGHVFASDSEVQARDAHAAMVQRTCNAWRTPSTISDGAWSGAAIAAASPKPDDQPLPDVDAARAAYIDRLQNAWRNPSAPAPGRNPNVGFGVA
jgi:hypothetical protein